MVLPKAFCASIFALIVIGVSAQTTEIIETEIFMGDDQVFLQLFIEITSDTPVSGQSTIVINTISNDFIVGFILFVGDGIDPTGVEILSISGDATTFGGVTNIMGEVIGGSSNTMMSPPLPVIIGKQCDTVAECQMLNSTSATGLLEIVVVTPLTGDIVISGPAEGDAPSFAIPVNIGSIVATILSDPHFLGLTAGVQYDFTGIPGRIYSIISDKQLAVNAQFEQAWRTGLFTDPDTLLTVPMYSEGTWMNSIGVLISGHSILFSTQESPIGYICPEDRVSTCFVGGSVEINGDNIIRLGKVIVDKAEGLSVELKNSKSFGRMTISSPRILLELDYVSPPKSWAIEQQNAESYSHINLGISRIMLTYDAHGVLGQTRREIVRDGRVIKTSEDKDAKGLIEGDAVDYELPTLFSTDFKYHNF